MAALAVEDRPGRVEADGQGDQEHQGCEDQQQDGGQDAVLDRLEQPVPAVDRALEQPDQRHVADLGGAEHGHAPGGQVGDPADVDAEMAQVAQGPLEQVAGPGGHGDDHLVELAGLDLLLELGEAAQAGDAARPAALQGAIEIEDLGDAGGRVAGRVGGGQALDGPHQLLAHADHGDAAGERAGDQSLAQGQTDGEAGADQGGGASHEPEADPQARDVPGGLDGVEEGDDQGDGGGPAGEQARDLPAQPDQPAGGIVAEPGQDLRGEQAAEQEGGQGGGRHAGIEAPPGDGGAGDRHGQDVADPDEALDQGAGARRGDAADRAAGRGRGIRAARRASATAPCRAEGCGCVPMAARAGGDGQGRAPIQAAAPVARPRASAALLRYQA